MMPELRKAITLVLVLTMCSMLASCAAQPTERTTPTPTAGITDPVKTGGEVVIGLEGDPERFVTTVWRMRSNIDVMEMVFSTLLVLTEDLDFATDLADRYEVSDDGLTFTFYLRDDVYFHDGEPVTAHDVAFTYNTIVQPGYDGGHARDVMHLEGYDEAAEGSTGSISGIRVIDDHTISFTLKEHFAPVRESFTRVGIMPKHILGDVPAGELGTHSFNYEAIGSGPFKLVEYIPDRHVIMEAFDDYYGGRPIVDRVVFRIASTQALLAAWLAGEIHAVPLSIGELAVVEASPHGDPYSFIEPAICQIRVNNLSRYFDDPRVRQALSLSIDRDLILNMLLDGHGETVYKPQPPFHWAYSHAQKPVFDPDAAGALLDDAGWLLNATTGIREKDGQPFEARLGYITDREAFNPDLAVMLQTQFAEVGLSVELQAWDSPTVWPLLNTRDGPMDPEVFDLLIASQHMGSGDPDSTHRLMFHSSQHPPAGRNHTHTNCPVLDEALERQAVMMEQDERQLYWHNEVWPAFLEQMSYVAIMAPSSFFAVSHSLKGFRPGPNHRVNNSLNWSLE